MWEFLFPLVSILYIKVVFLCLSSYFFFGSFFHNNVYVLGPYGGGNGTFYVLGIVTVSVSDSMIAWVWLNAFLFI